MTIHTTTRRTQAQRWARHLAALDLFIAEHGHARVPAGHVQRLDTESVPLGPWVGYVRQRYRRNALPAGRIADLEARTGWAWGPLRPGPTGDADRNVEIRRLRAEGWTLRQLAAQFNLSRQRIYQIAPDAPKATTP